ncbi:MAG: hypothetical protein ABIG93_05510 [archaeon]
MVFNWFFSDVFEKFYKKVSMLEKFLRIADKELLIDHFVELRGHFKQIKKILPELVELFNEETKIINKIPKSQYKSKLKIYSDNLRKELNELDVWVKNAQLLIEEILKVRSLYNIKKQKIKLRKVINHIKSLFINAQREAFDLVKLEKKWKKEVKKTELMKPVTKISIIGKLSNGWKLSEIQNVITELGGVVEDNPGGNHPYMIKFPKHRSIPLATSTPPFMLVKEVSAATGVNNKIIIASFIQGELLAA